MCGQVVGANEMCDSSPTVCPGKAFSAESSGSGWGPENNGTSVFGEASKSPECKLANSFFEAFSLAPGLGMDAPKTSVDHQPGPLETSVMAGNKNSALRSPFCTSGFEEVQSSSGSLDAFETLGELLPECESTTSLWHLVAN